MGRDNYILKSGITIERYNDLVNDIRVGLVSKLPSTLVMCSRKKLLDTVDEVVCKELSLNDEFLKIFSESTNDTPEPEKPKACQHKWRDFDWYLEYENSTLRNGENVLDYNIYEPYVCIHCHKRENRSLEHGRISLNGKNYTDVLQSILTTHPKIKNRAELEDEINDEMLVDREYLKWADFLRGRTDISKKPIELKLEASANVVEG